MIPDIKSVLLLVVIAGTTALASFIVYYICVLRDILKAEEENPAGSGREHDNGQPMADCSSTCRC